MLLDQSWIQSQREYQARLHAEQAVETRKKLVRVLAKYLYETAVPAPFLRDSVDKANAVVDALDKLIA